MFPAFSGATFDVILGALLEVAEAICGFDVQNMAYFDGKTIGKP